MEVNWKTVPWIIVFLHKPVVVHFHVMCSSECNVHSSPKFSTNFKPMFLPLPRVFITATNTTVSVPHTQKSGDSGLGLRCPINSQNMVQPKTRKTTQNNTQKQHRFSSL